MPLTDAELDLREDAAAEYAEDPAYYFSHALQVPTLQLAPSALVTDGLWSGELEILRALPRAISEHKELYIGSGHALGKDFITGGLPLWWQETRYPAKTILTGPTERQVEEITWNELERHAARRNPSLPPLGGRLTTGKYEWSPEHFILAFTVADSHQHIGKAQGFHSPHILIIVTEAQAVPNSVKEQLDGLTTSGTVLFIAIGNPLVTTGWFAAGLRDKTHNLVIHLDCEQSPNVLEDRQIIPGLVSKAWVEDKRRKWYDEDPEHPLWLSKVKGQLPKTSISNVFSRDLIDRMAQHHVITTDRLGSVGLDPAAFGDDESAFHALESGISKEAFQTAKHEPMDTAGRGCALRARIKASVLCIDTDGLGEGVASACREQLSEDDTWKVVSFKGSEKPTNERSPYLNKRAEIWFYGLEQLTLGKVEPPSDPIAIDELCEQKYFYNSKGKIQLEKKEDVKERLGRSPNRADAWLLAVWGLQFAEKLRPKGYPADRTHQPMNPRTHNYMVS